MSWDFYMTVDLGGPEPVDLGDFDANYTYTVSPMFFDAFSIEGGVRGLDGLVGAVAAKHLREAIAKLEADPAKYEAMNPSNGWGDYGGAVKLLKQLVGWCESAPNATMRVT